MNEDQLDIIKIRLSDLSNYSLEQFFDLALAEMCVRGKKHDRYLPPPGRHLLKDCEPNHGD